MKSNQKTTKVGSFNIEELTNQLIECIKDKKGESIKLIDLSNIEEAITDKFIVCHATSTTQVKAIGDHILKTMKTDYQEKPWHYEGFSNLEWVLIDYVNIVVHIFIEEKRHFYKLEELWSDAPQITIED